MSSGKIFLVGFGPGAKEHMSYRAREAIAASDVVIGYSTYIQLVEDQLEGKQVVRKGMTEEIDRSIEAYEQAKQGKTVALISSGDIGVYGMAGPTYEVLFQAGWTPESEIAVEVVPGSTALSACASRVGAPLTHDFCSISLSDLLTPWPTIARRLDAAAKADFVVALYNPKSGRRTGQIVEAQEIMLRHRDPKTPVAVVKSAYRELERIEMTTLDKMAECDIGMLTTVLIGNSSTFMQNGLMITPRGYANKYEGLTGGAKEGEKRGRSLTMGLNGWYGVVAKHIEQNPEQSLEQITSFFDMPMGEIVAAIAANDELAISYTASAIDDAKLDQLIDATAQWGKLRAVVRSPAAVTEILLNGDQLERKGEWLNAVNEYAHLHINWAEVKHGCFVQKGDSNYSVVLLDKHGQTAFKLMLVKQGEQFAPEAVDRFSSAREMLAK